MKITNLSVLLGIFAPGVVFAASNDFVVAAQLLAAAKNSDVQQIQILINNGANINYVDNTGMSLVCTALMNNDMRAAQVLQMYGADASNCDKQIKNYRNKNLPKKTGGFFGGLSTAQGLALTGAAAAAVVGGIYLFTDLFDSDDGGNSGGSGSGSGSGSGGNGGNNSSGDKLFSNGLPYGPLLVDAAAENSTYQINLKDYAPNDVDSIFYKNFQL
ncbi:MAG: ankyrin repeat domain-containing protein, partial [Alphaproteobacteria bacterium]|nr:ankyrin repeat domain-containing protein [Alphaproteobacteria bacterium]